MKLNRLMELCKIPGVSSREKKVRESILEYLKSKGNSIV